MGSIPPAVDSYASRADLLEKEPRKAHKETNVEKMSLPPGWGADSLTEFLEKAYRNRVTRLENENDWVQQLVKLDGCFTKIVRDPWVDPANQIAALLFHRSHAAYRAACEHAMAGQVADVFPLARHCLESAGYALHIYKKPDLGEVWLRHGLSAKATTAVRNKFAYGKIKKTIEEANRDVGKVFVGLYERFIEFGGHPNARSITGSLKITDESSRRVYKHIYLHRDGPAANYGLMSTAQAGVCALEILQEAFRERFEGLARPIHEA